MILETKLNLPQPKAGALLRTALIERIKNNLDKRLILICAGAGWGKTTLLAQLVKEAGLPYVFVHLDKDDSDLMTFYSYLIAGLEKLSPGMAVCGAGLIKQGGQIGNNYELLMGTLINELTEKRQEELFFILDDYQNLSNTSIVHRAMDYFIDHLPETTHVLIASRFGCMFPGYPKWVAKQEALELTDANLAFSKQEVKDLLAQTYRQGISESEMTQVLQHTEGWITGVQLILRHVLGGGPGKAMEETLAGYLVSNMCAETGGGLFDYFVAEIFSGDDRESKDFLIRSAVLDLMTVEACNAILEREDSEKMLKELERRNLFITRLAPGQYRLHRLFRDFLQKQLPDENAGKFLHLKAADYYSGKGLLEKSIYHLLEAKSYERAVRAIIAISEKMIWRGRLVLLEGWFDRLPEEITAGEPHLLVEKGWSLIVAGNLQEAEETLLQAKHALRRQRSSRKNKNLLASVLHGQSRICWQKGENKKALDIIRRAKNLCPESNTALSAQIGNMTLTILQMMGDFNKARALLKNIRKSGKYIGREEIVIPEINILYNDFVHGQIMDVLEGCKAIYGKIKNAYFYECGVIFSNLCAPALVAGDDAWAERCLKRGLELCGPREDVRSKAALETGFGILCTYQEKYEQARQHLLMAREIFAARQWPRYEAHALLYLSRLDRYCGRYDQALESIGQAVKSNDIEESVTAIRLMAESALIEMHLGKLYGAEQKIREIIARAAQKGFGIEVFRAKLALAAICLCRTNKRQGAVLLSRVIRISNDKGYNGILIQELRHNQALLEAALDCRAGKKHLQHLKGRLLAGRADVSATADFQVKLFGGLQLAMPDGRPVHLKWQTRKSLSLFAYLLLHRNRLCEREELMKAFWPGFDLKRADENLRTTVSQMKKTVSLGLLLEHGTPVVIHQVRGYRINPGLTFRLDSEEFCRLCAKAKAAWQEGGTEEGPNLNSRAVALYQDGFLPSLGERWCEECREEYEQLFFQCLGRLVVHHRDRREYGEAVLACRNYLSKEPFSEEMRIELWKALKALNRNAEIKKDFYDYKALLRKVLKEQPSPTIENEFRQLMM